MCTKRFFRALQFYTLSQLSAKDTDEKEDPNLAESASLLSSIVMLVLPSLTFIPKIKTISGVIQVLLLWWTITVMFASSILPVCCRCCVCKWCPHRRQKRTRATGLQKISPAESRTTPDNEAGEMPDKNENESGKTPDKNALTPQELRSWGNTNRRIKRQGTEVKF